jgi:hypothetical protein
MNLPLMASFGLMAAQSNPYTGGLLLSFKASDALAKMIDVAAVSEGYNRSQLIRRAVMAYLEAGGYFESGIDSGGSVVREMLDKAKEELER